MEEDFLKLLNDRIEKNIQKLNASKKTKDINIILFIHKELMEIKEDFLNCKRNKDGNI